MTVMHPINHVPKSQQQNKGIKKNIIKNFRTEVITRAFDFFLSVKELLLILQVPL